MSGMFNITVGAAPESGLNLDGEFRMVKAALLYGDQVKLVSSAASMVMWNMSVTQQTPEQQLDFLEELIPLVLSNPSEREAALKDIRLGKEIFQKKDSTIRDIQYRLLAKRLVADHGNRWFRKKFGSLAQTKVIQEYERATKAGLLEIHSFQPLKSVNLFAKQIKGELDQIRAAVIDEFESVVGGAISEGSTYPLFDDTTGELVRLGIEEGLISPSPSRIARAKHSKLAGSLLARLPLFDDASVNELLDIRRELERVLVRFRSAIMKYSETIRNASWDKDFWLDVEDIFHRDIEPAVIDIEDAVKSNSSMLAIASRKLVDKPALGTSIFSFILAQLSSFSSLTTMAIAASAGASVAVFDAYKESRKQKQEVEQNQLYFYYRAGELLSDRTYEYRKDL